MSLVWLSVRNNVMMEHIAEPQDTKMQNNLIWVARAAKKTETPKLDPFPPPPLFFNDPFNTPACSTRKKLYLPSVVRGEKGALCDPGPGLLLGGSARAVRG